MFFSIANFASSLTLKLLFKCLFYIQKVGIIALKNINFFRTCKMDQPFDHYHTTSIWQHWYFPHFFCVKSVQRTYFLWFSQWMLDRSFTVKCIICKASIPIQLKKKVWCDAKDFKCLDSLWSMNHVISKVVKVLNLSKRWSCNLSKLPSRSLLILRKNVVQ